MRLILLLLLPVLCARAQDMPQLRDGESRDHKYDCWLLREDKKLRLCVVQREPRKVLVEIPSALEALIGKNDLAPDLARKTRAYWSPNSAYVVMREPDNSDTQSTVILVGVEPDAAKRIPIDMEKLRGLSPKKHTDWSVEFGDWVGKRMFVLQLHGMTFNPAGQNEHDEISILCQITKDGELKMINADE